VLCHQTLPAEAVRPTWQTCHPERRQQHRRRRPTVRPQLCGRLQRSQHLLHRRPRLSFRKVRSGHRRNRQVAAGYRVHRVVVQRTRMPRRIGPPTWAPQICRAAVPVHRTCPTCRVAVSAVYHPSRTTLPLPTYHLKRRYRFQMLLCHLIRHTRQPRRRRRRHRHQHMVAVIFRRYHHRRQDWAAVLMRRPKKSRTPCPTGYRALASTMRLRMRT
jgi:hypothetical protein